MKLFEILIDWCEFPLFEGRIETLKSLYNQRIDAKLRHDNSDSGWMTIDANVFIDTVASYDPTNKKIYTQWLLNSFLKDDVKAEDLYKYHDYLTLFDKFKNKLAVKDINKYTPRSLFQAVKDIDPESAASKRQEKQQIKTEGADIVMKGPDCTILKLKTKEAACYYGRQTEWCTAATTAENRFDYYNKKGPLYVAICEDGRKFQFHIQYMQYMDEQDNPIDVKHLCSQYNTINQFFKNIIEPKVMKNAKLAVWYAESVIKGRWPEAEPFIVKNCKEAYNYLTQFIPGRWPEAEPTFINNSGYAVAYAIHIKRRWPEAESEIMKSSWDTYQYARDVIKDRWPEAEPQIIKHPKYAGWYAIHIIKDRWPEAESVILRSSQGHQYKEHFGIK